MSPAAHGGRLSIRRELLFLHWSCAPCFLLFAESSSRCKVFLCRVPLIFTIILCVCVCVCAKRFQLHIVGKKEKKRNQNSTPFDWQEKKKFYLPCTINVIFEGSYSKAFPFFLIRPHPNPAPRPSGRCAILYVSSSIAWCVCCQFFLLSTLFS